MFVYIDTSAHATYYDTLDEAQAAWLAGRGEGHIAEVLPISISIGTARAAYRTRQRDPHSRSSRARALLLAGEPPMRIAEQTGLKKQAVYALRSRMRVLGELT
jgi:hypothetical protein